MASLLDNPSPEVRNELQDLRQYLDNTLPERIISENLLIATWNICEFGRLLEQWEPASPSQSPKRNLHALLMISEIISRFDIVALQEVNPEITALREVMNWLGEDWAFIMTDVTRGDPGGNERLAFIFNTTRVRLSGLVCELVVPEILENDSPEPANIFQRQFARTPYAASFSALGEEIILTTLHVFFGEEDEPELREPELRTIANWLSDWARKSKAFGQNFIALGDFNIDRNGDPRFTAFTSTGLTPAPDLINLPRTIFYRDGVPDTNKYYDQIAWFVGRRGIPELNLKYKSSGRVNFKGIVMPNLSNVSLKFRISDHYPLWTEFEK